MMVWKVETTEGYQTGEERMTKQETIKAYYICRYCGSTEFYDAIPTEDEFVIIPLLYNNLPSVDVNHLKTAPLSLPLESGDRQVYHQHILLVAGHNHSSGFQYHLVSQSVLPLSLL